MHVMDGRHDPWQPMAHCRHHAYTCTRTSKQYCNQAALTDIDVVGGDVHADQPHVPFVRLRQTHAST